MAETPPPGGGGAILTLIQRANVQTAVALPPGVITARVSVVKLPLYPQPKPSVCSAFSRSGPKTTSKLQTSLALPLLVSWYWAPSSVERKWKPDAVISVPPQLDWLMTSAALSD